MMDSDPFSANATSQLSFVFKDAVSTEHSLQMTSQHDRSHSELLYHPHMQPHVLPAVNTSERDASCAAPDWQVPPFHQRLLPSGRGASTLRTPRFWRMSSLSGWKPRPKRGQTDQGYSLLLPACNLWVMPISAASTEVQVLVTGGL